MPGIILPKVIAAICLTTIFTLSSYSFSKQVLAGNGNQTREGLPGRRVGGGTRSDGVLNLVALVPDSNQGSTVSGNPKFFFYVPETNNPLKAEFMLIDENDQTVYEKTLMTNGKSGVIEIDVSESDANKPLEIGKTYRWYFALIPNPDHRQSDVYVTGSIKRVQPSQDLDAQLKIANPLEQVTLYAANNFWYDAIANLAKLRRSRPLDPAIATKWTQLLQSVNLNDLSQEPLVK